MRKRKKVFFVDYLQMPKWYSVGMAFASIFDALVTIVTFGFVGSSVYLNMFTRGIYKYVMPADKKRVENE